MIQIKRFLGQAFIIPDVKIKNPENVKVYNGIKLAGIPASDAGHVDSVLGKLANRLEQEGIILAGAVQKDIEVKDRSRCDMILHILGSGTQHPISANLGPMSRGCRLDSEAIENASWEVENMLRCASADKLPQLIIINKFGKSEAHGKGFSTCIALAIERDIPILCGIGRLSLEDFQRFAGDQAELLEPVEHAIDQWLYKCVQSRVLTSPLVSTNGNTYQAAQSF